MTRLASESVRAEPVEAAPAASPWQVVHVHQGAPAKPAFGAPCNGCGVCCLAEPCPLGVLVSHRRTGACDALRWSEAETRYRCGMADNPSEVLGPRWRFVTPWAAPLMRRLARRWISAGTGCDATLETDHV